MKRLLVLFFFLLMIFSVFAQDDEAIVGIWKFSNVSTSNPNCKDVSYFPIHTFTFKKDGSAEFISEEGIAKAKFKVEDSIIVLNDLSENGVKQEGLAEFQIKEISENTLTLEVQYECGFIDIVFKK